MSDNFLPILIVGSERSGTNLLRALLSTHSRIASPPPAGFISALGGVQSRYLPGDRPALLSDLVADVVALTKTHLNPWDMDLDPAKVEARVTDVSLWDVFRVVNEIYAEERGRSRWCSKEPGLFNYIPDIAKCIPNARFVYLVRDGRDVASSLLRGHLHEFHVYFAAHYWALSQRACLSAIANPVHHARFHVLRYEDLIAHPEDALRGLMRFLGLEFEKQQLRFYEDEKVLEHSRRSMFWKNLARPIDGSNKGKYKDRLGFKNIEIFESVAWAEMEALGYRLDSTHKKRFTRWDIRLYRAIASLRKQFWSMDPRPEGFRIRARVEATRRIVERQRT